MLHKLFFFIPFFIVITLVSALLYVSVHHVIRAYANDPQIQIVQDISSYLSSGQSPQSILPPTKVDISKTLAPFVIIFDVNGKPIVSSGMLGKEIPKVPLGVFQYAAEHGENRLTWEPTKGVRIAAVVMRYQGKNTGYVLAGRSLKEVEKQADQLLFQVALFWIIASILTAVSIVVLPVAVSGKK